MAASTLLLAAFLTATAAEHAHGESPLRADTTTGQVQHGQPATAAQERTPSHTTIINQSTSKEEIREIVQQVLAQQAQQQQAEPSLPSWLGPFLQYSAFIVAIFTALIVGAGVYLIKFIMAREKGMADAMLEIHETKQKLDVILEDAQKQHKELRAMTAEDVQQNPDKAEDIASRSEDYEAPIDRAIAEAIAYQHDKKYELAKERWLAIANITEAQDKGTAARAYFSAAYLIQEYDNRYKSRDKATINYIISLYEKALGIDPNNVAALTNRGNTRAELGQHEAAIEDFDKALKIKPDYVEALNSRGLAKADLKRHQEAIEDFDKALEIKPDYAEALFYRGSVKSYMGQIQEAEKDYEEALRIKPSLGKIFSDEVAHTLADDDK